MASRVKVTVYYNQIQSMFRETGEVWNFMRATGSQNAALAKRLAPRRTGALRKSIRWNMGRARAPFECRYTVFSSLDYALYVEEGTRPIIMSTTPGKNMIVRPRPYSWYRSPMPRLAVRGQRGQHFLEYSMQMIMTQV